MRKFLLIGLSLVAALYLLPAVYYLLGDGAPATDSDVLTEPEAVPVADTDASGRDTVTVSIDGKPTELPLERYIAGVVAAEISDDFPTEAIRAQAVAARTYAVYKMERGRPDAHPDADVCDDYHHCAAYRTPAEPALGGAGLSPIEQAVQDTAGQILTYEGAPIVAVFHCASGPRTEAADDVWGGSTPYLQSVVSPGGSACSAYEDAVTVSADDFRKAVAQTFPTAEVSGPPESWFKASVRSAAGGIKTVSLGGVTVEGTAVRELFGLHSTNFTITTDSDRITFHTIGYGHGVGLSQYGARYMAEQGAKYDEILQHYYKDTVLTEV